MADEWSGRAGSMPVQVFANADRVAQIAPGASVAQVAEALIAGDVGALVVSEGDDVLGVVSERDVVRALADGRNAATTRAMEIASTNLVRCDSDATVAAVGRKMGESYVRHVLIEHDSRLVGIVSARDLLGAYVTVEDTELG